MGGMEESRSVVAPAAALLPSAERNPLIRSKPRMDGAPGVREIHAEKRLLMQTLWWIVK
jgi:hypothetical protein